MAISGAHDYYTIFVVLRIAFISPFENIAEYNEKSHEKQYYGISISNFAFDFRSYFAVTYLQIICFHFELSTVYK